MMLLEKLWPQLKSNDFTYLSSLISNHGVTFLDFNVSEEVKLRSLVQSVYWIVTKMIVISNLYKFFKTSHIKLKTTTITKTNLTSFI